ncbi:hypothetical protein [Bradyrhizobium sp.]|uniref:hypothetical protein n=1 Tax=Bradyrhizobium sp. TaxID=376 RepID=UPI002C978163|nr:hypothetical protein [Bradyrhizobium sp.]HMM88940.1 hypothetical protein [Bradyrhizobium sp.]
METIRRTDLPPAPMRTQAELAPIAQRVAANPGLMRKFRTVIGSEDQAQASSVIDEITNFAQGGDPTVTPAEGVRITVVLMGMIGHPKDGSND